MLGLQSPKQRLLRTQDLHSRRRVLGEVHQRPRVANQPRTDQLAHQSSQIRRNGLHTRPKVFRELGTVLRNRDDLVTERVNVRHVGVGDFGTHGQLGSCLQGSFEVFGEDEVE